MIAQKIAELRKQKGLTQADMAKCLSISRQAYSFYELGKNEMDFKSLCKIADIFNVPTDYLLGRYDSKPFLLDDDDEISMVKNYRMLDDHGKGSIRATLEHELSHVPKTNAKKPAM